MLPGPDVGKAKAMAQIAVGPQVSAKQLDEVTNPRKQKMTDNSLIVGHSSDPAGARPETAKAVESIYRSPTSAKPVRIKRREITEDTSK